MLRRLTTPAQIETAYQEIAALVRDYAEWLFVSDGAAQSLRREEIDVAIVQRRVMLSCWTEQGTRLWRIVAWDWNGQALVLELSRPMGVVTFRWACKKSPDVRNTRLRFESTALVARLR